MVILKCCTFNRLCSEGQAIQDEYRSRILAGKTGNPKLEASMLWDDLMLHMHGAKRA